MPRQSEDEDPIGRREDETERQLGAEESLRLSREARIRNLTTSIECVDFVLSGVAEHKKNHEDNTPPDGFTKYSLWSMVPQAEVEEEFNRLTKAKEWLKVQLDRETQADPSR